MFFADTFPAVKCVSLSSTTSTKHTSLLPVHARPLLVHSAFGRSEAYALPSPALFHQFKAPTYSEVALLLPASSSSNTNTFDNTSIHSSRGFCAGRDRIYASPTSDSCAHPSLHQPNRPFDDRAILPPTGTPPNHPRGTQYANQSGGHRHCATPRRHDALERIDTVTSTPLSSSLCASHAQRLPIAASNKNQRLLTRIRLGDD